MQREGRRTQAERNVSEEHRYTGWPDGYIRRTLESPRFIPLFYLFVLLKYFAIFSKPLRTRERYIYIIVIVIMIESGSNLILRFDSDLFFHSEERRGGVLI